MKPLRIALALAAALATLGLAAAVGPTGGVEQAWDDLIRAQGRTSERALREAVAEQVAHAQDLLRCLAVATAQGRDLLQVAASLTPLIPPWVQSLCVPTASGAVDCVHRDAGGGLLRGPSPYFADATALASAGNGAALSGKGRETRLILRQGPEGAAPDAVALGNLPALLARAMSTQYLFGDSHAEVYGPGGVLLYHPNPSYLGQTWEEIEAHERPARGWPEEDEETEERARALFASGQTGEVSYVDHNLGGTQIVASYGPFPGVPTLSLTLSQATPVVPPALLNWRPWVAAAWAAVAAGAWVLAACTWRRAQASGGSGDPRGGEVGRDARALEALHDSLAEWVFSVDLDGHIQWANAGFREHLTRRGLPAPPGTPCRGALGEKTCDQCRPPDIVRAGTAVRFDARDQGRSYEVTVTPWAGTGGVELLHRVEDVTERGSLRAALVSSERRASAGVLAGCIAHEIGNAVTGLYGHADLLGAKPGDAQLAARTARVMQTQLDRVTLLSRNLLSLSRPPKPRIESADLRETFRDLVERLTAGGVIKRFALETEWGDLRPVLCDPTQLEQALTNLLLNAAQAMGDTGVLRLGTTQAGDEVLLSVADTGPGIHPDDLEHIFEPFFSTKGDKGTGLGLYVARQIAEAHRGRIEVASTLGRGTRFTLAVPTPPEPG